MEYKYKNMEIKVKVSKKEIIETLLSCYQHDDIVLSSVQKEIIDNINKERLLIRKDRQVGITNIINALIACKLISSEKIVINLINHNQGSIKYNYNVIYNFLDILINALELDIVLTKEFNNYDSILLSNGNIINIVKSSENNYTILREHVELNSWFIFDEVALDESGINEKLYQLYNYIDKYQSIKITIIGTQHGIDNLIFPIYMLRDKTNFKIIDSNIRNSEFFKKDIEYLKKLCPMEYDEYFGGKFVVRNPEKIDIEKVIKNMNRFIVNGNKLSMLDLINILSNLKICL